MSLDRVRFIKDEDSGRFFFKGQEIKQPDFRIVTEEGATLLVEVKNRAPKPSADFVISRKELEGLYRYCELSPGPELRIAIYWAAWNLWTLMDPKWLVKEGRQARVSLPEAMKRNEMVILGDMTLATEMPLALRLVADTSKPRRITDDGSCAFTVGRVEMLVSGRVIERYDEQHIAYTAMMFGGWNDVRTLIDKDNTELNSITFEVRPEEPVHEQGFQFHSQLSSWFSSYFGIATLNSVGDVQSLDTRYKPGGFGSLVEEPYEGEVLNLWRFRVVPSLE